MNKNVELLLQNPALYRAGQAPAHLPAGLPTGFASLDTVLPGGGWPAGCLTEILSEREGIGELSMLMPALAALSREDRWIAWISPPHVPYAPALSAHGVDLSRVLVVHARPGMDKLWAVEQALAAGTCGAVLAWPAAADDRMLRRLQLAAETGCASGFLFRPASAASQPSPAALRLLVSVDGQGLRMEILKCRGGPGTAVRLGAGVATVDRVQPDDPYPASGRIH